MVSSNGGFWQISWLIIGIFSNIFTEDRPYQYLQDAMSFGLLSDKSAE